jgi:thiosulfate dehydrogenase (quinone) large subunit
MTPHKIGVLIPHYYSRPYLGFVQAREAAKYHSSGLAWSAASLARPWGQAAVNKRQPCAFHKKGVVPPCSETTVFLTFLFLRFLCLFAAICLPSMNPPAHKALAYGTFRFALGVVELMHGLVRLPILAGFAASMAKQFEGTMLPGWFVYSFGSVLPFLEGLIGLALILGVFTRWTLAAASLLMSILIFGTCLRSDWTTVGLQMIYVIAFFVALFFLEHNRYSIDRVLRWEEP